MILDVKMIEIRIIDANPAGRKGLFVSALLRLFRYEQFYFMPLLTFMLMLPPVAWQAFTKIR